MGSPVPRPTARVILLDGDDHILLIRATDGEYRGSGRAVWLTPGGGIDPGETYEQAAVRELREEVGLTGAVLSDCVWLRHVPYVLSDGVPRVKHERYFMCRTSRFEVGGIPQTQLDMEAVGGFRWWSVTDIEQSTEAFAPRRLGPLLRALLSDGPPSQPFDVGL